MSTFKEANQVRLSLKMKFSYYAWYNSNVITSIQDGFGILIHVKRMNNSIRKLIAPVVNGVSVKAEID